MKKTRRKCTRNTKTHLAPRDSVRVSSEYYFEFVYFVTVELCYFTGAVRRFSSSSGVMFYIVSGLYCLHLLPPPYPFPGLHFTFFGTITREKVRPKYSISKHLIPLRAVILFSKNCVQWATKVMMTYVSKYFLWKQSS